MEIIQLNKTLMTAAIMASIGSGLHNTSNGGTLTVMPGCWGVVVVTVEDP